MSDEQEGTTANKKGQPTKTKPRGYRDLLVWQKGMVLAKRIYELTAAYPSGEKFGLVSQMRGAAVSIPSNIAEGQARKSTAEFIQFISVAEGSLSELDTQLQLSVDLGFLSSSRTAEANELLAELKRMLNGLRRTLINQ